MISPDFSFEGDLYAKGFSVVAGADEVGRGCFAGPVVAGCVIFGQNDEVPTLGNPKVIPASNKPMTHSLGSPASRHPPLIINDSKKLNQNQREIADEWIRKNALSFGIGLATVSQINRLGIKKATEIAYRKAIVEARKKMQIEHLLVDAFYIPFVKGIGKIHQTAIIKGDTKSLSIAAASIIAKVYRDNLMIGLGKHRRYKKYKWYKNKGYGTLEHRNALLKYGISIHHRTEFVNTYLSKVSFQLL